MGHQPFESWLFSEEQLLPDQEQKLHDHIESCVSCQQVSTAWEEVQGFLREIPLEEPVDGFTQRWQTRLADQNLKENYLRQHRISWLFFALTAGAALLVFGLLIIQYFTSVQTPVQAFITGITLLAGMLTIANAIQVAFIPFLEVLIVSVPPLWWFILAFAASMLTLVVTLAIRQILYPRRVSL